MFNLPHKLNDIFVAEGHEIRIVGGAVRDFIIGVKSKDIDLATTATPEQIIAIAEKNGLRTVPTGIEHGTVTVILDDVGYEITTLRVDAETDGRHAVVKFTTSWEQDAERRDLTINAMSADFQGNIFDYFGGREDLENQVVRFVGDAEKRITEDFLRILRAFRFVGRFNAELDDEAKQAIAKHAHRIPEVISGERIWSELSRILTGWNVMSTLAKMEEVMDLKLFGITHPADFTGASNAAVRLAMISRDDTALVSWKPSSADLNAFRKTHELATKPLWDIKDDFVLHGGDADLISDILKAHGRFGSQEQFVEFVNAFNSAKFPVSGSDLLDKGLRGPKIGSVLRDMKLAWVRDMALTKTELLDKFV